MTGTAALAAAAQVTSSQAARDVADASGFLQAGGRVAVLIGPTPEARSALLDGVMERVQGPAVLVGNKLNSPLTLHRVLFQAGAVGTEADKGAALLRSLSKLAVQNRIILAVNDAQTLTPDALTILLRVATTARIEMRLILLGLPSLLHAAAAPGFEALRDPTVTLIANAPGPAPMTHAPRRTVPRRAIIVAAVLALASVTGAAGWRLLRTPPPDAPVPPASVSAVPVPSVQDGPPKEGRPLISSPPSSEEELTRSQPPAQGVLPSPDPVLAAVPTPVPPPSRPEQPPAAADAPGQPQAVAPAGDPLAAAPGNLAGATPPATDALRRDFDAFLDRAGSDTARLSGAARDLLFRDYVAWRGRRGRE